MLREFTHHRSHLFSFGRLVDFSVTKPTGLGVAVRSMDGVRHSSAFKVFNLSHAAKY